MSTTSILLTMVGAAIFIALLLMIKSHRAWLARQTPVGVWRATDGTTEVTLEFEGGPAQGTYKQISQTGEVKVREFGSWEHHAGKLHLLMMAGDQIGQPGFGASHLYRIRYLSPDQIAIEGPHRPQLTYMRAPEGLHVEMKPASH